MQPGGWEHQDGSSAHTVHAGFALGDELEAALSALERLNQHLLQESRTLERFLTDYLTRIGPYFGTPATKETCQLPASRSMEQHTRQQFHKLARRCHPDRNGPHTLRLMQAINQAYRDRNLARLKRLEIEADLALAPGDERNVRLRLRLQSLHTTHTRLSRLRDTIRQSPEYLLMQKVEWNRRLGIDFIAELEEELAAR